MLGRITGKVSTSEFKFIVQGTVKKWDYVSAIHPEVGPILAQVTELERAESTIAHCTIIGYRSSRGFLRRPRTPLAPDSEIIAASDQLITETLGLAKRGLYLGLLEGKPSIRAYLDPDRLLTRHLAVIAKSGAGKSYAVGIILEELAECGFPAVIIDPHGEYSSMREPNDHGEDLKYATAYGIKPKGYAKQIKEYSLNTQIVPASAELKLPMPRSPLEFIDALPFKLSNGQKSLLYSVLNQIKEDRGLFDFDDIINYMSATDSNARWNLISAIENIRQTSLFSVKPTDLRKLVKPGQLTIINLKGASPELQEVVVALLAIKLFEQRKLGMIPPFFLVFEEAHTFCPERGFGEARSSRIIRTIASEGRKFGLGLCVISQRPARIDKNVLSQCASQIILQVTNPNDLKAISNSFEGVTAETENEIKSLPTGKALVIGAADYPTFVDIRIRRSAHGGRAQKFELEQTEKPSLKLLTFKPQILKKELEIIEENVKDAKLVLIPAFYFIGEKGGQRLSLVIELLSGSLLKFDSKLQAVQIPFQLGKLSPMQKKVMDAVARSGKSTVAELMLKTETTLGEAQGLVNSLCKLGLLKQERKSVCLSETVNQFAIAQKASFPIKPDYYDLPGEQLKPKVSVQEILQLLSELGFKITNYSEAWLPAWRITYEDGSTAIKDALSLFLNFKNV